MYMYVASSNHTESTNIRYCNPYPQFAHVTCCILLVLDDDFGRQSGYFYSASIIRSQYLL